MMKRVALLIVIAMLTAASDVVGEAIAMDFSWFHHRDVYRLDRKHPAPCIFPPADNPCAVPCRPPWLQPQAVPCAIKTACPSLKLPCHGVSYGKNPYPIFR